MIFEINTWVWLAELGVSLAEVPGEVWDATIPPGTDAVWLMGVWSRSLGGQAAGPNVVGSAYCVRDYTVDPHLGGPAGLAAARDALRHRGLRLILDWVPNHVAPDHAWAINHPECFIEGSGPEDAIEVGGRWIANGRDPYFPPWPDVVQLNVFRPELRELAAAALVDIADQCDGVRCDMAMLVMDDVFARTWGPRAGPPPDRPYWPELIAATRAVHPDFFFMAEAYWDLESALLQQGFDACYDKRLYDRLVGLDPAAVRAHLSADLDYQRHMVRFLENHDEPRAATTWPADAHRASAIAVATLPGTLLIHEGQLDGRQVRVPVELGRRPDEPLDSDLRAFYERLLPIGRRMASSGARWSVCPTSGWPDNQTHGRLLAWTWAAEYLVVVNLAGSASQGRVAVDWPDAAGDTVHLVDHLDGRLFDRSGDELIDPGLYVELGPWQAHLLRWER